MLQQSKCSYRRREKALTINPEFVGHFLCYNDIINSTEETFCHKTEAK